MYFLKKIEHQGKIIRRYWQKESSFLLNVHRERHCNADIFRFPESLNEKIVNRMLYTKNDLHTQLADKYKVRDYVAKTIGEGYLVPLLGVWRKSSEIDYASLPDRFVLKCNHDSGSYQLCLAKDPQSIVRYNQELDFFIGRNFYYVSLEWHYKNISPLIIGEEYIDVLAGANKNIKPELYRVHCFHSKAKFIEADFTNTEGVTLTNIYDECWRLQDFTMGHPNNPRVIKRPGLFNRLIELAEKLSENIDYCRVDFFMNDEKIWFNEITFTPERGKIRFLPRVWDYKLGALWQIS